MNQTTRMRLRHLCDAHVIGVIDVTTGSARAAAFSNVIRLVQ